MRAQFILSEVGIGLRRNLSMTVSVVLVTMVSLFFVGAGLLFQAQVSTMKDYWYDRVQVSVFLCGAESDAPSCAGGEVTQAQRDQVVADLTSPQLQPYVEEFFYESKQEAYERFVDQFEDSALVDNVTPEQMPESYRIRLVDPEQYEVVSAVFRDRPGVEEVQDQRQLLDRFFSALNWATLLAALLAGLMLLSAVLLVATTIRLAAFSRRRETGIMRLVGASDFYIQLPFILEGAVAGLVGGVFATGGLIALKAFLIDKSLRPAFRFTSFIGWDTVWQMVPVLVLVGILLASSASFVTLRRHLRV